MNDLINVALFLAVLVAAAWIAWRRGARMIAVVVGLFALLPALTLLRELPWPAYLLVAAVLGVFGWHRCARSAGVVARWSAGNRRRSGVASTLDITRTASATAMRRRATTVRPSLAELSRWELQRLPVGEVGLQLCRSGVTHVYASPEDVVMMVGGPRTGKTGLIASLVLDFPGAAVVTSTRTDLLSICGPLRAKRGPVLVFNAVGLGGIESTITFDPLTGCGDPVAAVERATDLLAATSNGGSGDREFWDAQARRVLAALLHAAALGHKTMADVQSWVAKPDHAAQDVPALLRRSGVAAFVTDVEQFVGTNDRTRTSITSTVMPALGWLTHPAAAAAAQPGAGFDVEELLASRATVFLLGAEETQAAPLVCALTGHIARQARRLAVAQPGGRIDPPLGLFLDEAALISPVPLESWTADMGGRGVTICAAFQSRAQLLARWGEHNAAAILNNTGAVVIFGGTRDRDDLLFWSTLAGERDEWTTTTDLHGRVASRTTRRVAVVAPAQIANLPAGRVLVIRRALPPVLGRARMAWRRLDVAAHHRPDALTVRARLLLARTRWAVLGWVGAHAGQLTGVLVAMWAGASTAAALTPSWRGWAALATAAAIGWLTASLIIAVREPVTRLLSRRVVGPLWTWMRAMWARLRLRVTGHTGHVPTYAPYQPSARLVPVPDRDDQTDGDEQTPRQP